MGYQDFTQTFQEKKNASVKEKIVIKNVLLQGLHKTVSICGFLFNRSIFQEKS